MKTKNSPKATHAGKLELGAVLVDEAGVRATRVVVPTVGHVADANVRQRHPAELGTWVWHPEKTLTETAVVRFRLRVEAGVGFSAIVHVTGDQRFQLRCDGRDSTFGPDRCDPAHWTVHSLRLELEAGAHELEALVWYIADPAVRRDPKAGGMPQPPMAQMTLQAGFMLFAEGVGPEVMNTGVAAWRVEDLTPKVGMERPVFPFYHDVGPSFRFDVRGWEAGEGKVPQVILPPTPEGIHGIHHAGWWLCGAELPEQKRERWSGGRVRAFRANWGTTAFTAEECAAPGMAEWQAMLEGKGTVTIPANTRATVLWDVEKYICGYPEFAWEGGEGAEMAWDWAEGLYDEEEAGKVTMHSHKRHRGEVVNKCFMGFGDSWTLGARGLERSSGDRSEGVGHRDTEGTENAQRDEAREKTTRCNRMQPDAPFRAPALWWRCGRYVRVRVATGDMPLTLTRFGVLKTGFPLDFQGAWKSSDAGWDRLLPIFENAFRVSAHETWTDTPYYEQMCYLGDTTLHAMSTYPWVRDDRLNRRAITLFDWSRLATGLAAERYPSRARQECSTFSMIWPAMVRDFCMWRDDAAFVQKILPGVRSMLSEMEGLVGEDGLLGRTPGWLFVDWVPSWDNGYAPGSLEGDSSIVNLHLVLALVAAAQVEEAYGDAALAGRNRRLARETLGRVLDKYWDAQRGVILDTTRAKTASEHSQAYALLSGLLPAKYIRGCLAGLERGKLVPTTIYATHYVLNALYLHGREAALHQRLAFWRALPDLGFTATPETPEPTRSDSHAWGAHPLWHTVASVAGIRPAAPGFAQVRIAPLPGDLTEFFAKVVHPRGFVTMEYRRGEKKTRCVIGLPKGVTGTLELKGKVKKLGSGRNVVEG